MCSTPLVPLCRPLETFLIYLSFLKPDSSTVMSSDAVYLQAACSSFATREYVKIQIPKPPPMLVDPDGSGAEPEFHSFIKFPRVTFTVRRKLTCAECLYMPGITACHLSFVLTPGTRYPLYLLYQEETEAQRR